MHVPDFVPFEDLQFQTGNVGKLRWYNHAQGVFDLGQEGVLKSKVEELKALVEKNAVMLVVIGGVVGIVGTIPLRETPFGQIVSTAGGFIMAAGLIPLILGALG